MEGVAESVKLWGRVISHVDVMHGLSVDIAKRCGCITDVSMVL